MNIIDFLQAGGYRLKQATLGKMQTAYLEILKAFVSYHELPDVGNFIISGCTVVGTNITAGILYIDGELCPFEQVTGTDASLVKKQVITESLAFKNGSNLPVFRKTTAVVDAGGVTLSDFIRLPKVKDLVWDNVANKPTNIVLDPANLAATPPEKTLLQRIADLEARPTSNVPVGLIAIWNLPFNQIPKGWVEYEDLRGLIPVGHDATKTEFNTLEFSAGSTTHTLTIDEIPKINIPGSNLDNGDPGIYVLTAASQGGANNGININPDGGQEFSIMNPYRVVYYIQYVG